MATLGGANVGSEQESEAAPTGAESPEFNNVFLNEYKSDVTDAVPQRILSVPEGEAGVQSTAARGVAEEVCLTPPRPAHEYVCGYIFMRWVSGVQRG